MAPQSTKKGPRDPWGNVKIPSLEAFNSTKPDQARWFDISSNGSSPDDFSSLVGLPIVGLPDHDSTSFTLEASYLSVVCGDVYRTAYPGGDANDSVWATLDQAIPGVWWPNKSSDNEPFLSLLPRMSATSFLATSFYLDTTRDSYRGDIVSPDDSEDLLLAGRFDGFVGNYNKSVLKGNAADTERELAFASLAHRSGENNPLELQVVNCSLSQKHVEVEVQCTGEECVATRIRKSLTDTRSAALTGFEHYTTMSNFAAEFPKSMPRRYGSTPTERFLADTSSSPYIQQSGSELPDELTLVNLSTVTPSLLSRRLSVLLNTYYQLSMQPAGYFGSLSKNFSVYGPALLPATDLNAWLPANISATNHTFTDWWLTFQQAVEQTNTSFIGAATTANVTISEEIFACNYAWLALLWTASAIVFITGVVSLVLKRKTLGPELFGFVTSMTYHSERLFCIPFGRLLLTVVLTQIRISNFQKEGPV